MPGRVWCDFTPSRIAPVTALGPATDLGPPLLPVERFEFLPTGWTGFGVPAARSAYGGTSRLGRPFTRKQWNVPGFT